MKVWWLAMVMRPWSALEIKSKLPFPIAFDGKNPDGCVGFVPVFETQEQAEAFADGAGIHMIAEEQAK